MKRNNKNNYRGDFIVKPLKDIDLSQYEGYKDMSPNYFSDSNAIIYEALEVEGNLSLDWNEDYSFDIGRGYGLLIVTGDLEVTGNISNYGNGGLALLVLGNTKAKNLIGTGTLIVLNSAEIKYITLGAYAEGFTIINTLKTTFFLNDNHHSEIKNRDAVKIYLNRDALEYEEEQSIAKCFYNNPLLLQFTDVDEEEDEYFLHFNPMVKEEFFETNEKKILKEILGCMIKDS